MKKIRRFDNRMERQRSFPQLQKKFTGSKRHPVIFYSRKRYAEAEEEE
jgi:hypothetical protein